MKTQEIQQSHAAAKRAKQWPVDEIGINILLVNKLSMRRSTWKFDELLAGFWRIYHNDAAGASLDVNGDVFEIEPDSVYLIPANLSMASSNSLPFTQTYIHLTFQCAIPSLMSDLFTKPYKVPHDEFTLRLLRDLGDRLDEHGSEDLIVKCFAKSIAYNVVATSFTAIPGEIRDRCWNKSALIEPVLPALDVLNRDLHKETVNRELAALCNMSEDYFIRVFRKALGVPPGRYLLHRRIAFAAEQLLYTRATIDLIAESTGFCDRFHFSRVFAQHVGVPPAAYRRRAIAQQPD